MYILKRFQENENNKAFILLFIIILCFEVFIQLFYHSVHFAYLWDLLFILKWSILLAIIRKISKIYDFLFQIINISLIIFLLILTSIILFLYVGEKYFLYKLLIGSFLGKHKQIILLENQSLIDIYSYISLAVYILEPIIMIHFVILFFYLYQNHHKNNLYQRYL